MTRTVYPVPPLVPDAPATPVTPPPAITVGVLPTGEAVFTYPDPYGGTVTELYPADPQDAWIRAMRRVSSATAALGRASAARAALPPGTSRARITTANARASRAAYGLDMAAARLDAMTSLMAGNIA